MKCMALMTVSHDFQSLSIRRRAVPTSGTNKYQDDECLLAVLAIDLDRHFPDLVSLYQSRLRAHALDRIGNPWDAEEVVQEVFERIYYALKGYPVERIRDLKLRAW